MMDIDRLRHERVTIAETTRALLGVFAAGDPARPLPRLDADWDELFKAVCRNGLLGLTQAYLRANPNQDYPPPDFRNKVRQTCGLAVLETKLKIQKVCRLLASLNQAGLDYLVIKGPAVAYTLYPEPTLRSFNDLDIVVRERDWATAHQLLRQLGFEQVQVIDEIMYPLDLPAPPPKLAPSMVVHEVQYFNRQLGLMVELHFDDILIAGLAARDGEGFWQRAVTITVEGVPCRVMSLEDQLIHLCAHIHYHGYTRLHALSDIAFIVRNHAAQLDWERVLAIVRREEAEVAVYYSLYYLDQLLAVTAPAPMMAALRPDRFRRWWHDWFMPPAQIVALAPMWRPDFSFYFLPLFKRLLPDLLVMGRRGEKLRCLLRLLLPPADWLRYYYQLSERQSLLLAYLLHPAKLSYHYLAEVFGAVTGQAQPDDRRPVPAALTLTSDPN